MPQVFRIFGYTIYFWTNEGRPLEPIHVHVAKGAPYQNATKIWITSAGKTLVANNNSKIPPKVLRYIRETIESQSDEIIEKWIAYFGLIEYFI